MHSIAVPSELSELRTLLESVRDGYLALDTQWRFTYVNRVAGEILGDAPEGLLGRTLWEAYPGLLDGSPFAALYRRTMREGVGDTLTAWYPDHQRWYEVTTYRTGTGIAICFRDVTARQLADARRLAEAESLQRLIDANPYGVHVLDDALVVRYANAAARAAFASVPQFVGMDFREALKAIWPADIATELGAIFERVLATGEPYATSGLVGRRRDRDRAEAYDWRCERIALPGGAFGLVTHFYDLTERERHEAALAASEQRFRAVQESSPDGFMMLEAVRDHGRIVDFQWLYSNAAADRLVNAPPEGLVGRRLMAVHPGNRDEGLFEAYVRVVETGEPFVRELRYRRDGLDLELRLSVVRVNDGFAVTIGDRREQRRLEAELQASESRRTRALRSGQLGTWEYTVATGELTSDESLAALFGLPPEQRARFQTDWQTFIAPADVARIHAAREQAIAARAPLSLEYRIRRADGIERWVQVRGEPEFDADGAVVRYAGTTQDITERRVIEAEAEASRARLEEATRAAKLGIHEYYPESGRLVWDARVRDWWGLTPDEPVTYEKFVARVHPDDRAAMQAAVDRALDPVDAERYEAEYRVCHPDGTVRWMQATGQVTFANGRPVRLIGTVQDISASKAVTEQLTAADRQKDVFLATLSHELRNPLAPIRTAAQLLARPGLDATQVAWAQTVIQRQAAHMASLLDDLLDIARITQGKLNLKRERVSLATVVDTAVEAARPLIERKHHRLTVTLPAESPALEADPVRLAQVLSNLLTNAAKYTDAGGRIELAVSVDETEVAIRVTDSGVGMAPDALAAVFEMFSQVHGGRDRAEGGLGIGLALVRGLVELHGGSVQATSAGPGRGSTFTVRLPLAASRAAAIQSLPVDGVPSVRRKVLVIDDNRDAADMLATLLRLSGHEVRVGYDGTGALALARAFRPDVAVLDIGLPGMNGYALARAWREEPWGRDATLVALTGWGQDEDRQRSRDAGFDLHLTKPVDPAAIESLLTVRPARRRATP